MATLYLTVKKQWFDLIASGQKKEEYREIKPYWETRLKKGEDFKTFNRICFTNGYSKSAPYIIADCKGIDIGPAVPEWSGNWQGDVFRIKIGELRMPY